MAAKMTPPDAAASFLSVYGPMFGIIDPAKELVVKKQKKADKGRSFVRYQQTHNNVPVFGGELIVQMDAGNNVVSANGKVSPSPALNVSPAIDPATAKDKAVALVSKQYNIEAAKLTSTTPELWIYNPVLLGHEINKNFLVWRIEVTANNMSDINELVLVDAQVGLIALHFNQVPHAKNRKVYDNYNDYSLSLPGPYLVRSEGGAATGIADVDLAYQYTGYTYDFYWTFHARDSIDNFGMPIISTVRYCPNSSCPALSPFQNAYWNRSQMVFGAGFSSALDVVGHELTHGVTQYESGLFYYMQSGAINESLSDVWGELIEQTYAPPAPAQRWLIGETLPIGAIRSMSNPPAYNQPDKMTSPYYQCDTLDSGEVHHNSGVNSKAAYLMVDGATFNGKAITGIGITKTIKIYYEAQTNLLASASDYADLYNVLQLACNNLIGTSGITTSDCQQVKNAVDAVEMNFQNPTCSSFCPAGSSPVDIFYDHITNPDSYWATTTLIGGNAWTLTNYVAEPSNFLLWGQDLSFQSESYIKTVNAYFIPNNSYLHFFHQFDFEYGLFNPKFPSSFVESTA